MEYLEKKKGHKRLLQQLHLITVSHSNSMSSLDPGLNLLSFFFRSLLSSWFISSTSDIQSLSEL